jgi:YD repeat-containing protein
LVSIIDRNGNATQLSYDSSSRLTTVTDPAARHLYFSYPDGSSQLVSSVTSDFGISLSYTYDTQGRLTRVTKPDNTTVSFEYDAQSMITAVRDSDGKLLESHTYDALGRGITGARANGVESVTVTYP